MKHRNCIVGLTVGVVLVALSGAAGERDDAGVAGDAGAAGSAEKAVSYRKLTDMLHLVMSSDRIVYTRKVVQRLTRDEQVITASEHYQDDAALPLPAQMFRYGAELASDASEELSYSLLSLHPINRKNGPVTEIETQGLRHVADKPGENFYGAEALDGERYFVAIYPDYAVAEACVNCHNNHKDSPRRDAKVGDVMGAVVIRVLMP